MSMSNLARLHEIRQVATDAWLEAGGCARCEGVGLVYTPDHDRVLRCEGCYTRKRDARQLKQNLNLAPYLSEDARTILWLALDRLRRSGTNRNGNLGGSV